MRLPYYFENRLEAHVYEDYLYDKAINAIKLYGCVTVLDVHDFIREIAYPYRDLYDTNVVSYELNKYGWTEPTDFTVEVWRERRGYYINVSEAKQLNW